MKTFIKTAVIASLFASVSAFAHHPAEDMIDPDTWAMIDQNLADADSPHLDLDFDDMGAPDTSSGGGSSAGGSGGGSGGGSSAGGSSRGGSGNGGGNGGSRR